MNRIFFLAYLDPGSGSILLQCLAGAFLGALLAAKLWTFHLKQFLRRHLRFFSRPDRIDGREE